MPPHKSKHQTQVRTCPLERKHAPISLLHAIQPADHPRVPLAQMLEQPTTLKVRVGMNDSIEVCSAPRAVVLDLFDFALVAPLEDAVACDVVALLADVVAHRLEHVAVVDAHALQHRDEVVRCECAVWAAVRLTGAWEGLGEDLLARVGRVATASAVRVAAYVAVGVANVVAVFFLEFFVRHELEGAPPEDDTFVEAEADSLQEESVLQTTVVLKM